MVRAKFARQAGSWAILYESGAANDADEKFLPVTVLDAVVEKERTYVSFGSGWHQHATQSTKQAKTYQLDQRRDHTFAATSTRQLSASQLSLLSASVSSS
jgi:hypothetical protein